MIHHNESHPRRCVSPRASITAPIRGTAPRGGASRRAHRRASRHQLRDRARRAHRDRPSPHVRIKEVDAHTPRALRPERARLPWHASTYLGAQQRQRCAPGTPAWAPRPSPPGLRDSRARDGLRTTRLGLLPRPCGVVARGVWPPNLLSRRSIRVRHDPNGRGGFLLAPGLAFIFIEREPLSPTRHRLLSFKVLLGAFYVYVYVRSSVCHHL